MNWWDNNADEQQVLEWVGDCNAKSRVITREHIIRNGYKSILDCGAGPCSEYYGYKGQKYDIEYKAIDTSENFVSNAIARGISITNNSIDDIPHEDNSSDVVYVRHVLEHLNDPDKAIKEMIRVAKKEVIIIFFIPPHDADPIIRIGDGIYHNIYNKKKIEDLILSDDKTRCIDWEDIGPRETILHIYIKQ